MARQSEERRQRVPFGVPKRKLNVDAETAKSLSGKRLRWISDVNTRIIDAQAGGYEFVEGNNIVTGDAGRKEESDKRVRKPVDKNVDGSTRYAYLMAIPEEFYKEDQEAKEAINKKVDDAIRGGSPTGLQHHGVNPSQGEASVKSVQYQP